MAQVSKSGSALVGLSFLQPQNPFPSVHPLVPFQTDRALLRIQSDARNISAGQSDSSYPESAEIIPVVGRMQQ